MQFSHDRIIARMNEWEHKKNNDKLSFYQYQASHKFLDTVKFSRRLLEEIIPINKKLFNKFWHCTLES